MEIVAEISGNHGGKLENALALIRAAKEAGADAIKFQCFDPLVLAHKRQGITWEGREQSFSDLLMLYKQTQTPHEWFPELVSECDTTPWFSSVFMSFDVDYMESLDCPRYKISAYEMLDGDLINAVAATGKPIIMSVRPRPGLTILRATDYDGKHGLYGLSDHSRENVLSIAAAEMGVPMIERHICLDGVTTPDSGFSLNPNQFAEFVRVCRESRSDAS